MAKIMVGMSGGVDSSVAAALLKEQGHEVEGVFMKNWSPNTLQSLTDCPWEQDLADAETVANQLGIPFRSVNFEQEYKKEVVDYFLAEYAAGRTPNPDVMCNKAIKFAAFLRFAQENGAEGIATGHYARVTHDLGNVLWRGKDIRKDQSYFLYALGSKQLGPAYFPVGELTKPEVREKAEALGLVTAGKKDSQGICFIGHLDVKKFLLDELGPRPGHTYLLPEYTEGESFAERAKRALVIGEHRGAMFYTIGERAGDAIDNGTLRFYTGQADTKPVYTVATEGEKGKVFVSLDPNDPHLFATTMLVEGWMYTGNDPEPSLVSTFDARVEQGSVTAQARYQQPPVKVHSVTREKGLLQVKTDPLHAVAPGQSLVLYEDDRVWGGGVVCSTEHTIQFASSQA